MPKDNYTECIKELGEAQNTDHDLREMVREADHFLNKRDGQWEPEIVSKWTNRPRYTFDSANPIVDDIMGEMLQSEFDIRVVPAGDLANRDIARYFEGIIRNIENISNARFTYDAAARIMVGTGFAAWRVATDYRKEISFNQDLIIEPVADAQNSLWFDPGAKLQTMEDAGFAWLLNSLTMRQYEEMYPKGSKLSVSNDISKQVYSYKKSNEVIIAEYFYKKTKKKKLLYLSNGQTVPDDEDFQRNKDELTRMGIEVVKDRTLETDVVYKRCFDGGDWLEDSKETPFAYIPIVPVYGNFRISENKVIYWGAIEKIMDAQRVINYSESKKIEEGALAPRGKYWATKDQAVSADVRRGLRTLNLNSDPVQFYDHAEGQPPPFYQGAPNSNPNLVETTQSAMQFIQRTSGTYDEARGTAPAQRSGTAIDLLQAKSDNPKRKWFTAVEIALAHTARILIDAIPKVYDTPQEMQLINQDGSLDKLNILQPQKDEKGREYRAPDLSIGRYNVTVTAGPAFHSRQQETVAAINELAQIDPSILQIGGDILLNNIDSPGVDKIAERKRLQMLQAGLIPQEQMTDEEKAKVAQAQQQGNQPSPIDQANLMIAQATAQDIQGKNQERGLRLQLEQQKIQLKQMELDMKAQQANQSNTLELMKSLVEQAKTQAETLKLIKEAMGADAIISRPGAKAYEDQAERLYGTIERQTERMPTGAQNRSQYY